MGKGGGDLFFAPELPTTASTLCNVKFQFLLLAHLCCGPLSPLVSTGTLAKPATFQRAPHPHCSQTQRLSLSLPASNLSWRMLLTHRIPRKANVSLMQILKCPSSTPVSHEAMIAWAPDSFTNDPTPGAIIPWAPVDPAPQSPLILCCHGNHLWASVPPPSCPWCLLQ